MALHTLGIGFKHNHSKELSTISHKKYRKFQTAPVTRFHCKEICILNNNPLSGLFVWVMKRALNQIDMNPKHIDYNHAHTQFVATLMKGRIDYKSLEMWRGKIENPYWIDWMQTPQWKFPLYFAQFRWKMLLVEIHQRLWCKQMQIFMGNPSQSILFFCWLFVSNLWKR